MVVTVLTNTKHGCRRTKLVWVRVPADLSYTGRARWAMKPIDACLAQLVRHANLRGYYTSGCCCGHGEDGNVVFTDGTRIPLPKCQRPRP